MDFSLSTYYPIFIYFVFVAGFAVAAIVVPHIVGPRKLTPVKEMPYESGMDPVGSARMQFDIKFYLIAILFVIFDVEAIYLYPWAVTFDRLGLFALVEMLLFIGLLLVGYVYAWKKGVLQWEQ